MSDKQPVILIVEDDEDVARINARMLKRRGYDVRLAFTVAEALVFMSETTPDLYILDVELPDGDGFSLCRLIRKESDVPVLFLTGKAESGDSVTGVRLGGDYYLKKPYNMDELVAITDRLIEKSEQIKERVNKAVQEATVITRGALTLNVLNGKAYKNGRDTELTQKEFSVLLMLVKNEDKELSGEVIYESIWGLPMNDDSTAVRNQIYGLKKKLETDNTDDYSILTRYGGGYTFTTK